MLYYSTTEDYDISSSQIELSTATNDSSSDDSAPILPPTDTGMDERERVYTAIIENQRQR